MAVTRQCFALGASLAICASAQEIVASNSTVANEALGIYVVTSAGEAYANRIRQARLSWAPPGSPVLFVAAAASAELGVEALPCPDDEERGVCCKTMLGLRLALHRFPRARWLVRAVDDTVVLAEHLVRELQVFDHRAFVYVGSASVTLLCHIPKFTAQCGELHGGGGGGIVVSRPLAEELVRHSSTFLEHCRHDDVFLGQYLRYVLGVHLHVLPGVLQEPRFERSTWELGRPIARCSRPLPPSVYAPIDDWGTLHPFAPTDVSRLALVHADPEVWPHLVALAEAAAELGKDSRSRLLAYADSQGRRIVAPHFRGASILGVCAFDISDLLASIGDAAASTEW